MSKKLEFAERATQPGAKLAALCREFGITRPTGRKWRQRYLELGPEGLEEESRRPKSSPLALAEELVAAVLEARDKHPSWGPKKIHQLLRRRFGERAPSRSTVARMLRRFGRIQRRRARAPLSVVEKAPTVGADKPNDVWTVDFKGWWKTHDGNRCEPLTVRDAYSRFVLTVTLTRPTVEHVKPTFEALFRKHGLPAAIQCDNGCPFVHVRARAGLSRLSAWWASLGIRLVRSRPGCPQDNGGHERMHADIAREIERSPAPTIATQQRLLDKWRQDFNHVRPHEKLDGKTPAEIYRRSERRYQGPLAAVYPSQFIVKPVFRNGAICLNGEHYFVSVSLAGHDIGLEQLDELRCKVWFRHIDCGDLEVLPQWMDDFAPRPQAPRLKPNNARPGAQHQVRKIRRPRASHSRAVSRAVT
jgi:transposase InsO family protein